jgi:hypothetical protein
MSDYRLQVIHLRSKEPDKVVMGWQPGDRVETDLAEELAQRIKAKGVGLFRTEKHVMEDVRKAVAEMLWDLKGRVR